MRFDMLKKSKELLAAATKSTRESVYLIDLRGGFWSWEGEIKGGNHCVVHPPGGGFVHNIPFDQFTGTADQLPDETRECFTGMDGNPEFPCIANPNDRWNGWACPMFTEKVARQIVEQWGFQVVKGTWTDSNELEIHYIADPTQGENILNRLDNGYWSFDGWCWDLYDAEGNCI